MKYEKCKTKLEKAKWFLSHKISAQLKTFWDDNTNNFADLWITSIGGRCVSMKDYEYKFITRAEAIDHGGAYKRMCQEVVDKYEVHKFKFHAYVRFTTKCNKMEFSNSLERLKKLILVPEVIRVEIYENPKQRKLQTLTSDIHI